MRAVTDSIIIHELSELSAILDECDDAPICSTDRKLNAYVDEREEREGEGEGEGEGEVGGEERVGFGGEGEEEVDRGGEREDENGEGNESEKEKRKGGEKGEGDEFGRRKRKREEEDEEEVEEEEGKLEVEGEREGEGEGEEKEVGFVSENESVSEWADESSFDLMMDSKVDVTNIDPIGYGANQIVFTNPPRLLQREMDLEESPADSDSNEEKFGELSTDQDSFLIGKSSDLPGDISLNDLNDLTLDPSEVKEAQNDLNRDVSFSFEEDVSIDVMKSGGGTPEQETLESGNNTFDSFLADYESFQIGEEILANVPISGAQTEGSDGDGENRKVEERREGSLEMEKEMEFKEEMKEGEEERRRKEMEMKGEVEREAEMEGRREEEEGEREKVKEREEVWGEEGREEGGEKGEASPSHENEFTGKGSESGGVEERKKGNEISEDGVMEVVQILTDIDVERVEGEKENVSESEEEREKEKEKGREEEREKEREKEAAGSGEGISLQSKTFFSFFDDLYAEILFDGEGISRSRRTLDSINQFEIGNLSRYWESISKFMLQSARWR